MLFTPVLIDPVTYVCYSITDETACRLKNLKTPKLFLEGCILNLSYFLKVVLKSVKRAKARKIWILSKRSCGNHPFLSIFIRLQGAK